MVNAPNAANIWRSVGLAASKPIPTTEGIGNATENIIKSEKANDPEYPSKDSNNLLLFDCR